MPAKLGYKHRYFKSKKRKLMRRRYALRKKYKKAIRKKYYAKKRFYRRIKRKIPKKVHRHGKAIKALQHSAKAGRGDFISRDLGSGKITVEQNQQAFFNISLISKNGFETDLNRMPFYNPSAPGTLVTANMALTTFSNQVLCKSATMTVTLMNNIVIPIHLDVYLCSVKADTDKSPETFIQEDIADLGTNNSGGSLSENSPLIYPSDCVSLNQVYKIQKLGSYWHMPGAIRSWAAKSYNMSHNFAAVDSHQLNFTRKLKSKFLLFLARGPPAHDASIDAVVGRSKASVDYEVKWTYHIVYNAGQTIKRYKIDSTLDTFTNNATIAVQPQASNKNFQLS